MARFRPFPKVDARYGAPMGRPSIQFGDDVKPLDLAIAGPAYEYDVGGAYWGLPAPGEGPVWAVWRKGHGHEGVCYVRAHGRLSARARALGL